MYLILACIAILCAWHFRYLCRPQQVQGLPRNQVVQILRSAPVNKPETVQLAIVKDPAPEVKQQVDTQKPIEPVKNKEHSNDLGKKSEQQIKPVNSLPPAESTKNVQMANESNVPKLENAK